ncbi:hypothetical protein IKF88_01525 [Candidatus Saccharibacteria bacterium]|nr:hypothetical protein [Candidatus Saccharibacteria bacterium]
MSILVPIIVFIASVVFAFLYIVFTKSSDKAPIWPVITAVVIVIVCALTMILGAMGQKAILKEVESKPTTYQLAKFTDGDSDYYLIQNGTNIKYLYTKDGKILINEVDIEDVNIHVREDSARVVVCEKTTQWRPQFLFLYGVTREKVTYKIDFYIPDGNAIAYNGRIGDK